MKVSDIFTCKSLPPFIYMNTCTLYYGCPYDEEDRPATVAVLEADSTQTAALEFVDLTDSGKLNRSIKLVVSEEVACSARYARLVEDKTRYYIVTGYEVMNKDVRALQLLYDPFLTEGVLTASQGGYSISGMISRISHHGTTTETPNTLEEPFTPSEQLSHVALDIEFPEMKPSESKGISYVATTIDMSKVGTTARKVVNTLNKDGQVEQYKEDIPDIQPMPVGSSEVNSHDVPYAIYEYNSVSRYMYAVNALGLSSAILDLWSIPSAYHTSSSTTGSAVDLNPKKGQQVFDISKTGATSYNNIKAAYHFCRVEVISNCGGDNAEYRWIDVAEPSDRSKCAFQYSAVLTPDGCPVIRPTYIYGGAGGDPYWIRGGNWIRPGYVFEGSSGVILANNEINNQLSQNTLNRKIGTVRAVAGVVSSVGTFVANADKPTGITGAVSGMANTFINAYSESQQLNEQKRQILNAKEVQNSVYTPAYVPHSIPSAQVLADNNFRINAYQLSSNDLHSFDTFLTKYGWAVSKRMDGETLNYEVMSAINGLNFVYIQFDTCTAKTRNITNRNTATLIENTLLSGVRFWKVAGKITTTGIYNQANYTTAA